MQAQGLPDIIDLEVYFVGQIDSRTKDFDCMHGPEECVGDILLLCAHNTSHGNSNPYAWWGNEVCMMGDQDNIPDNAQSCAQKNNLNWDTINTCANGQQGIDLFTNSINVSNNDGIYATPTVIIAGQTYVGGPDNPLQTVCQAYTGTAPPGCSSVLGNKKPVISK